MTDAEREALVERMAEAAVDAGLWPGAWAGGAALGHGYPGQVTPPMPEPQRDVYRQRMRAALAEAEPAIRADEREACATAIYTQLPLGPTIERAEALSAIRARGDA